MLQSQSRSCKWSNRKRGIYGRKSIFRLQRLSLIRWNWCFDCIVHVTNTCNMMWHLLAGSPHPDRAVNLSLLNLRNRACLSSPSVCFRVQHDQLLQRGGPSVLLQDEGITTGWKQHVLPTNTARLDVVPESAPEYLPVILTRKSKNTASLLSEPGSCD